MEIKPLVRDVHGLITGLTYVQNAEGMIDWRKMIKPEYLVPNNQVFEKLNKPIPTTIEGLEDKELLILLGGIKELARLRGFTNVNYRITSAAADFVMVACHIEWIPNFETEGRIVISGGTAGAHPGNTNAFGRNYLTEIAENRAFVRCVRNFLGIKVVGFDEICSKVSEELTNGSPEPSPAALLEKLMQEKGVSFDSIKAKLATDPQLRCDGAENFTCVSDIPKAKIFTLLERLRKKK